MVRTGNAGSGSVNLVGFWNQAMGTVYLTSLQIESKSYTESFEKLVTASHRAKQTGQVSLLNQ